MTPRYPSQFQRKTLWSALTGLAILTIGLLISTFIWLTGQVLGILQPVLVPLAVAGIVAYLLDPIVSWLQTKGLSRLKSVIAVFASALVIIALFLWMIIPPIADQITNQKNRETLENNTLIALHEFKEKPWVSHWLGRAKKLNTNPNKIITSGEDQDSAPAGKTPSQQAPALPEENTDAVPFEKTRLAAILPDDIIAKSVSLLKGSTSKIFSILGLVLGFAMLPIYLYYFLKESSGIKTHWHEYVPLKASHFKDEVIETLSEINGYLISFFRGQMLVAFIDGVLVGIALWAFGLPYGLVIGMCMAILGVIPYIGNILCLIPACIIAYVHFGQETNQFFLGANPWIYVAAVCAIFFIVQQINSLATAPKIVGDSVGLHPMTVIFSMLFWSILLGGFIGALLAVPLTAAVKVLFRRYVWEPQMNEQPPDPAPLPPVEDDDPELA